MASIMAMSEYNGSRVAAQKELAALGSQCLDKYMPAEWPGHAKARATAKENFAAAHAIDNSLGDLSP